MWKSDSFLKVPNKTSEGKFHSGLLLLLVEFYKSVKPRKKKCEISTVLSNISGHMRSEYSNRNIEFIAFILKIFYELLTERIVS